jgi:hypothetical protein
VVTWTDDPRFLSHDKLVDEVLELRRALDDQKVYRFFYRAWWDRERETTDFDLHAATVARFKEAHEDVIRYETLTATEPH